MGPAKLNENIQIFANYKLPYIHISASHNLNTQYFMFGTAAKHNLL